MLILLKIVLIAIVFALLSHLVLGIFSLIIVELTRLREWSLRLMYSKNYKSEYRKLVKSKQ